MPRLQKSISKEEMNWHLSQSGIPCQYLRQWKTIKLFVIWSDGKKENVFWLNLVLIILPAPFVFLYLQMFSQLRGITSFTLFKILEFLEFRSTIEKLVDFVSFTAKCEEYLNDRIKMTEWIWRNHNNIVSSIHRYCMYSLVSKLMFVVVIFFGHV